MILTFAEPLLKYWQVFRVVVLVAIVAVIAGVLLLLPVADTVKAILEWVDGLGMWGPVALAALYVPATIFFLPGSVLTLAAGFLFGVYRGILTASIASTLGAAAAFLIGRFLLRDWIQKKVARRETFRALNDAVAEQGLKVVLLTRLSPAFPFNFLNYALSVTHVSFRDYLLGSWLGMLPGTALFVYIGSSLKSLRELADGDFEGGWASMILLAIGLVATLAITVIAARMARAVMNGRLQEKPASASS